jgi:CysZ protein
VGLLRGFLAPFRGAVYIARERLWRHLVVPILLNLALGVVTLAVALHYLRPELTTRLGDMPVLMWIALVSLSLIGGALIFILLQPVLSAVFCDRLSEVVEKRVRGSVPAAPLLASIGHALLHGLLKLALYALAIVVGAALFVSTGIGSLVGVGLGAIFLAYDGFDYPLARRNASFAAKWAYLMRHPFLAVGYGLGTYVLYLVPLAFVVAPPFAAVGATLAYLEDDTREDARKARVAAKAAAKASAQAAAQNNTLPKVPEKGPTQSETASPEQAHNPVDISAS